MKPRAFLELGRISNLPTVWTNVLAGLAVAGAACSLTAAELVIALSLMYTAGMFLNDAFDRKFDERFRPERSIPSGRAAAREVFVWGFGMLASGAALAVLVARHAGHARPALAATLALGVAIVIYNARHKGAAHAPALMGLCRALVYVVAAIAATGRVSVEVLLAATCVLLYVAGLTSIAAREMGSGPPDLAPRFLVAAPLICLPVAFFREPLAALPALAFAAWTARAMFTLLPRSVPGAVVALIAGLSLFDAALLAGWGKTGWAIFAGAAFGLTVVLQKHVKGT